MQNCLSIDFEITIEAIFMINADVQHPEQSSNGVEAKQSRFSPTVKGAIIGAVAGSILPVFGTFSGALIGGVAGKIYQKKCSSCKSATS